MGALCCGNDPLKAPLARHDKSEKVQKETKPDKTLLLLGVGSAGKTTLSHSLQIINGWNLNKFSKRCARQTIRCEITKSIRMLIIHSNYLYNQNPDENKA